MNTTTLKKSVAAVAFAAVAFFGIAAPANALTQTELLSQALSSGWSFDQFMTAYNMAFGGTTTTTTTTTTGTCGTTYGYTATTTLRSGMNGAAVTALQTALNNYGGASLVADGAYGPATSAAVMAFQASQGLGQDGIAGPNTQGALASASMMTVPCTDTDGDDNGSTGDYDLSGNVGSASYELVSQYANEEVGEGEEDVVVAGLRVEAGNDSDIMVTSIKLSFAQGTSADSTDLDDYASEIKVWFDGEEVGSLDADDFSEQSNDSWQATLPLDAGVVIDADEEEDILVSVSALNNLDSGDIDTDAWTVDFQTVRFVDGDGVVTSEDAGTDAVAFDFADFATASDIEMKVAKHNSSPEAMVVEVDTNSDTDGVELLKFTIKAEGTDITIEDLPVFLTVTGATDVDVVANTLTLEADGEEWSESITSSAATATVTFDDIDFTIDEGDTVTFTVSADINDIDTGFDEGDTLKAELTAGIVDAIDAEDEIGDAISDTDATGTALGDAMAFYSTGIRVSNVSIASPVITANDGADNDTGTFEMTFEIESFGGTVYVSDTAAATTQAAFTATVTSADNLYRVVTGGSATVDGLSDLLVYTTSEASNSDAGQIELAEGESTTVTVTVTRTNNATNENGIYQVYLEGILWNTTDATNLYNVYDFDFEDYYSSGLFIN